MSQRGFNFDEDTEDRPRSPAETPDPEDRERLAGESPGFVRGWNNVKHRNRRKDQ